MLNRQKSQYSPSQREIDLSRVQEELLRLVGISNGAIAISILAAASQEVRLWPLLRCSGVMALWGLIFFTSAQFARLYNHYIAFRNENDGKGTKRLLGQCLGRLVLMFGILAAVMALSAIIFAGISLWENFPMQDKSPQGAISNNLSVTTNNN